MTTTINSGAEATAADLSELAAQYASALYDLSRDMDVRGRRAAADAKALRFLGADFTRLQADPTSDDDRLTVADWRAELGLCPDGDPHFGGAQCSGHECPTYRQATYDDHIADTGRLR